MKIHSITVLYLANWTDENCRFKTKSYYIKLYVKNPRVYNNTLGFQY